MKNLQQAPFCILGGEFRMSKTHRIFHEVLILM